MRRRSVLLLHLQIYFFAVDRDIARGLDAEADTVAVDFNDSDFNLADHDGLAEFAGENEHDVLLS